MALTLILAPRLKKEKVYNSTPPLGLRGLLYVELCLYSRLQNSVPKLGDNFPSTSEVNIRLGLKNG